SIHSKQEEQFLVNNFNIPFVNGWYGFKIGLYYPSFTWIDGTPYDYGPDPTATVNKAANKQYCSAAPAGRCYYGAFYWKDNIMEEMTMTVRLSASTSPRFDIQHHVYSWDSVKKNRCLYVFDGGLGKDFFYHTSRAMGTELITDQW
uniref:Olfactomedin-like domain-containing protein n=1 Tax=Steinernema glaseri TaxID=37863 RepID=A0A1I7YB69_9BILA